MGQPARVAAPAPGRRAGGTYGWAGVAALGCTSMASVLTVAMGAGCCREAHAPVRGAGAAEVWPPRAGKAPAALRDAAAWSGCTAAMRPLSQWDRVRAYSFCEEGTGEGGNK